MLESFQASTFLSQGSFLTDKIRFVYLQSSSSDGNNNGESRAVKKSAVNIEGGPVDDGEKRLSLIRGKGGQSKLFFV